MIKPQGKLFYPKWVNSRNLIIGDISYRRADLTTEDWAKYVYTGSKWIGFDAASKQLIQTSYMHQRAKEHINLAKNTGII